MGIGASRYRTETALSLLREVKITVIRGNASELRILLKELTGKNAGSGNDSVSPTRGVDASFSDEIREDTLESLTVATRALSAATGSVTVMTGAIDIASNGEETWLIRNGCPQMSRITGSGCMLDGIIAAYIASTGPAPSSMPFSRRPLLPRLLPVSAGNGQQKKAEQTLSGTGSFRCCFLDEVSLLDEDTLKGGINIEVS